MSKPIVCIDFDGVIHSYTSGWTAIERVADPPVPGAFDAIRRFQAAGWQVDIFSSRSASPFGLAAMRSWLEMYAREEQEDITWTQLVRFPVHKPPAVISIDDRGFLFGGDWSIFDPVALRSFQPWNKQ